MMENSFSQLSSTLQNRIAHFGYDTPTDAQEKALPEILNGENVLIVAPTGTGKTEAALFPVFDLFLRSERRARGISILYITPLRALNRDILRRMTKLAEELDIHVEVRHGDTSASQRRHQTLHPPEMLIITPETLQAILVGRILRTYLASVRWVVVDEVHELVDNKRGNQLAIALERLRELTQRDFQRIGASATIGTPELVARFLVGPHRKVKVVNIQANKEIQVRVDDARETPQDARLASQVGIPSEAVARLERISDEFTHHETSLIFTNTRELAELLASRLRLLGHIQDVGVHHGALSAEERIQTEEALKSKKIRALVCTSSLELGIDIGSIDFVIQYMSPRQATTLLQRIGRSGHTITGTSRGIILPISPDDACEAGAILLRAKRGLLEEIDQHDRAYDVLAHQLVGLLLDKPGLTTQIVLEVIKRAWPYRDVTADDVRNVAEQLASEHIIVVRGENLRRRFKATYEYYYENLSMIPDTKQYTAKDIVTKRRIGHLDSEFVVVHGRPGQAIILSGRLWKIAGTTEEEVFLEPIEREEAAIPSWVGELIPVSTEVAQEVGKIRKATAVGEKPSKDYSLEPSAVENIAWVIRSQLDSGVPVPTDENVIVESTGKYVVIHACNGSRANETLGILIAALLTAQLGAAVGYRYDPYRILLILPYNVKAETIRNLLQEIKPEEVPSLLENALVKSDLYLWRLQHVARRFGLLSRESDVRYVRRILPALRDTLIHKETLREIFSSKLDVEACRRLLTRIQNDELRLLTFTRTPAEGLSPLAQDLLNLTYHSTVTPGKPTGFIYEVMKSRLEKKTVRLLCIFCGKWNGVRTVHTLKDPLQCPLCGSKYIAVTYASNEDSRRTVKKQMAGRSLDEEKQKDWKNLRLSAELVANYGARAIIALAAYGVGPTTATRILRKHYNSEAEFYTELLEAEKDFVRTRVFWQDKPLIPNAKQQSRDPRKLQ